MGHAGDQAAQGGQLLGLHQLGHDLAEFGGAFGNPLLQVFPVPLQFFLHPFALGDIHHADEHVGEGRIRFGKSDG